VRSAVTAPEPASEAQATRPTERVRLPVPPTELIGREDEIAAAMAVLDPARSAVRLLTLTGPGEVGKTRLALAVASALADAYADGVVFVDLAPQRDARPVPATIARSLEVRESGGRSAHDLLLDHLRDKHALLVLDNCEHVLAAAPLLSELLAAGPRLALLATSRAALRLRGEQRFPVRSLATPAAEPSLEAIAAAPAVRLFVERAQAVAPDFVLDASTASAVAAICSHLDGLPLAIELAAARTRLLGPAALLGRLERPFAVLMGGRATCRTASRRYATHWPGVTLCSARADPVPAARAVCRRWTLEAAEAVCSGADLPGDEVLDRLTALVDASLVHRLDNPTSEPRFGMLETVREYAREHGCRQIFRCQRMCTPIAKRNASEAMSSSDRGRSDSLIPAATICSRLSAPLMILLSATAARARLSSPRTAVMAIGFWMNPAPLIATDEAFRQPAPAKPHPRQGPATRRRLRSQLA
jgi:predicted ATPase